MERAAAGVLVTPGAGPGEVPGHAAAVWPAVTAAAGQMVIGMDREGKLPVRAAGGIQGRWCVLARGFRAGTAKMRPAAMLAWFAWLCFGLPSGSRCQWGPWQGWPGRR